MGSVILFLPLALVREFQAFFRFLHREFSVTSAARLATMCDESAAKKLKSMLSDSSNFGLAKSFFSAGRAAGFEMTSKMEHVPETSESLIARVKQPANEEAWAEFQDMYRPVILRMARRRNLQDADAQDACQKILFAVSQAISEWEPHPERPFRAWLGRIARNAILNAVTRRPKDRATGLSEVEFLLHEVVAQDSDSSAELILETRRQLFHRASQIVRCEFTDVTWRMFWETEVDGQSVETVATSCGRTSGAVYIARCRVMKRLKEYVQSESQIWGGES